MRRKVHILCHFLLKWGTSRTYSSNRLSLSSCLFLRVLSNNNKMHLEKVPLIGYWKVAGSERCISSHCFRCFCTWAFSLFRLHTVSETQKNSSFYYYMTFSTVHVPYSWQRLVEEEIRSLMLQFQLVTIRCYYSVHTVWISWPYLYSVYLCWCHKFYYILLIIYWHKSHACHWQNYFLA